MEVKFCKNREDWSSSLEQENEFLQSFDWGEFKKDAGEEVIRIQVLEKDELKNQFQGILTDLKIVKYLYLPRIKFRNKEELEKVIDFLKKQKIDFVRVESTENLPISGLEVKKVKNRQPETTWVLDINKSEEDLLSTMHSKTRYNINLASRKGVQIKESEDVEIFWNLVRKTSERQSIKSHNKLYYEKMLALPFVSQIVAFEEGGTPIASNIMIDWKDEKIYLHGASDYEYRKSMAPYLLQWYSIKQAKDKGQNFYDFWGVAPVEKQTENFGDNCFNGWCWDDKHSWAGVTRFKVGFGGQLKTYPSANDIVLNKFKYLIYEMARKIF
jgi:lipid II:glycine glycyltransferase (peptidoglycan interpeptide bridge formation enzyme)